MLPKHKSQKLVGFLAYKTKVQITDFKVNEIVDIKTQPNGQFILYRLTKEGWNTVDTLIRIAKASRIKLTDIQYGGKKDRHGITSQYITSKKALKLADIFGSSVTLEQVGRYSTPMNPNRIVANQFELIVRSIQPAELTQLQHNFNSIKDFGFTNYFDSQRFSTFDRIEGLPAFALYKGDYESCLKQMLLGVFRREKSHTKDRKANLLKLWGNWSACLNQTDIKTEQKVFELLLRNNASSAKTQYQEPFRQALELLPFEELLMMLSAFQAYLWNQLVSDYIQSKVSNSACFKTRSGILAFPPPKIDLANELSLPGEGEVYSSEFRQLLDQILNHLQLPPNCTQTTPLKKATMNSYLRPITIIPTDFSIVDIQDDDLAPNQTKLKAKLSFNLPKGAYGTMLVKRLTVRSRF